MIVSINELKFSFVFFKLSKNSIFISEIHFFFKRTLITPCISLFVVVIDFNLDLIDVKSFTFWINWEILFVSFLMLCVLSSPWDSTTGSGSGSDSSTTGSDSSTTGTSSTDILTSTSKLEIYNTIEYFFLI